MVRESNRHGNACNQSTGKGPRFVSVESLRPLLRRSAYPSHARPATASRRARCGPGPRSLALTCISAGPVVYEPLWQALEKSSCTTLSSSRRGRRRGRQPLQSACRCARREPQEGRPSVSGRHRVHWARMPWAQQGPGAARGIGAGRGRGRGRLPSI